MDEIVLAYGSTIGEERKIVHFLLMKGFGWFCLDGNKNVIAVTKSPREFTRATLPPEVRSAIIRLAGVAGIRKVRPEPEHKE